jgi:hypothetical protein
MIARIPAAGALTLLLAGSPHAGAQRIPLGVAFTSMGYEKIVEKAGITGYKHRTSDIIRLGAEGRIAAPVEVVRRVLLDYQRQIGAVDRLSEVRVIASSQRWLRVYQRLNLPVISDRDFVLDVTWGQDRGNDVQWISFRAINDSGVPERRGVVRVRYHEGSWQLKPIESGRASLVRFQVAIDLGGWLPKWMARGKAGPELPALYASICKLARSPVQERNRLC